jgi:hypothetical protein
MDWRTREGTTGSSSMPRASSASFRPQRPNLCTSRGVGTARSSPTVWMASAASFSAITWPTPGSRAAGSGVRKDSTRSGRTTYRPSGLRWSEAILATNLFGAIPAEAVSDSSSRMLARIACATSVAVARPCLLLLTSR